MRFLDRLRNRSFGKVEVPTVTQLEKVWGAFSEQWPEDNERYDCWKPASTLPAPKEVVKIAIKQAYANWPEPIDWTIFSAFFTEFVDLATYLSEDKYNAIQRIRAGRLMKGGVESSYDPFLGFTLSSSLASVSTPATCSEEIIRVRDRLRRSEAWNPVDTSDNELEQVRQILLESVVEHATLIQEWRFYILSICRDKHDDRIESGAGRSAENIQPKAKLSTADSIFEATKDLKHPITLRLRLPPITQQREE